MTFMVPAFVVATMLSMVPQLGTPQAASVLHIKVVVIDAEGKPTPVPRYVFLLSDNPTTAPPRRIVTTVNGTANVSLRPGNYTVESDEPFTFQGKTYQWTKMIDIAAGRDSSLELTADNAEVAPIASTTPGSAPGSRADPSALLTLWQDSVVGVWTPITHASGFLIDRSGLVATNQRGIGSAVSVEVQLSRTVKVAAAVLAADPVRDVAVLWIDPKVSESVRAVPLRCAAAKPALSAGQPIFTIGTPLREAKDITSGVVSRVETKAIRSDFGLAQGSAGGPVLNADGDLVGMTSVLGDAEDKGDSRSGDSTVVPTDIVCDTVAAAQKKMMIATRPSAAPRPVEPMRPFPEEALKDAAQHRAGSLNPYQISALDFDVAFMTPVLIYGAQYQVEQALERERANSNRTPGADPAFVRPLMEFSNWSEYVRNYPPVLLIRVTPKLVEGFWMKVARGAAQTQGVSVPPIKHVKSGFSRLRALCGEVEVTPIHPFKLEQRVGDGDAIYEGLYAFDPGALGPQCGSVKLVLYSEKEPQKADTRIIDPSVVQQIWQDFAPYRALK